MNMDINTFFTPVWTNEFQDIQHIVVCPIVIIKVHCHRPTPTYNCIYYTIVAELRKIFIINLMIQYILRN